MAKQNTTSAALGFEAELFKTADKLRGTMEPSDYKHVVLGLIFLKHISDSFEAKHTELLDEYPEGAEDRDEYLQDNIFWVPQTARWSHLQANARQPNIGKIIDDAMLAIEKDNAALKGVLPKEYARPALSAIMLGELIDMIANIKLQSDNGGPAMCWGGFMSIFWASSRGPRANAAANFTRPDPWSKPWWKCCNLLRAAFMIRAAGPAECLCNRKNLSKITKGAWAIWRFTDRKATIPLGGFAG